VLGILIPRPALDLNWSILVSIAQFLHFYLERLPNWIEVAGLRLGFVDLYPILILSRPEKSQKGIAGAKPTIHI
jgi:hypothetical protein